MKKLLIIYLLLSSAFALVTNAITGPIKDYKIDQVHSEVSTNATLASAGLSYLNFNSPATFRFIFTNALSTAQTNALHLTLTNHALPSITNSDADNVSNFSQIINSQTATYTTNVSNTLQGKVDGVSNAMIAGNLANSNHAIAGTNTLRIEMTNANRSVSNALATAVSNNYTNDIADRLYTSNVNLALVNVSNGYIAGNLDNSNHVELATNGNVAASRYSTVASNASNTSKLQGFNVTNTAPANGQVLMWNSSSNFWEPSTVSASASADIGLSNYLSNRYYYYSNFGLLQIASISNTTTIMSNINISLSNIVPGAGRYEIVLKGRAFLSGTSMSWVVAIFTNGVQVDDSEAQGQSSGSARPSLVYCDTLIDLAANTRVEVKYARSALSTGTVTITSCSFRIRQLR